LDGVSTLRRRRGSSLGACLSDEGIDEPSWIDESVMALIAVAVLNSRSVLGRCVRRWRRSSQKIDPEQKSDSASATRHHIITARAMSTDGQGASTDGQLGSSVAESVPQIADLASSELAAAAEPAKADGTSGPALAHRVHRPDEVTLESDTHSEVSQTESDKQRAAEVAAASQVVIETLGMPWPKYRTPQCTPINSEYSLSESGFYYGLSACADSCSCCASRWANGRDGVAQLKGLRIQMPQYHD
jgi:hypothetical protein